MKVENLKDVQLAVSEIGVGIEKQLDFLADALEQKIDYDDHAEVAEALYPVSNLLRAVAEKTQRDFEHLWTEIHHLQEMGGV